MKGLIQSDTTEQTMHELSVMQKLQGEIPVLYENDIGIWTEIISLVSLGRDWTPYSLRVDPLINRSLLIKS
ncbi:hypothetical protein CEXT_288641 [Caerostris extrusa]|uniref:Uncharacterized protein n=1 Tax=Caerostris extrusa TaxID=172846 RepID=A0AAV4QH89_CAEEX|nr:hypothetical protein CEXT_288641 [Caerostris extrusa]